MKLTQYRLPAVLCALTLPLCALIVHPVLEMAMNDDFSYTKSAQLLAQTGHITYVGWSTPALGWQLYLGALFIKLFGFSFTVVRLSTLFVAMITAFLTQRTFVRAGLNEWNASVGALALMLSPLTMALTFSYMTDIGGLFCFVLCLYQCLRALQADSARARLGWIVFAACSNVVGGTVRQIVWLGVIVMIPCTCWLLRKHRHVVLTGVLSCSISYLLVLGINEWFKRQPYSQAISSSTEGINLSMLIDLCKGVLCTAMELMLLMLPLSLVFFGRIPFKGFWRWLAVAAFAGVGGGLRVYLHARQHYALWLAPYLKNYLTVHGLADALTLQGERPVVLSLDVRLVVTCLAFGATLCFLMDRFVRRPGKANGILDSPEPMWQLKVLLLPFSAAYFLFLLPIALFQEIFDRYLLTLFAIAILFFLLYCQRSVFPRIPAASLIGLLVFAGFGVACMHDAFAMSRAWLLGVDEIRSSGVPRTGIDGGLAYNGWTQIEIAGYMNSDRIGTPAGAYVPHPARLGACKAQDEQLMPVVRPLYALSYDPNACGGPAPFPAVPYHAWLGPHWVNIYVVRDTMPEF